MTKTKTPPEQPARDFRVDDINLAERPWQNEEIVKTRERNINEERNLDVDYG